MFDQTTKSGKKQDGNGGVRTPQWCREARVAHMARLVEMGQECFADEGLNMAGTHEGIVGPQKVGPNDGEFEDDKMGATHPLAGCFCLPAADGLDFEIGEDGVTEVYRRREDDKIAGGAWEG